MAGQPELTFWTFSHMQMRKLIYVVLECNWRTC